MRIAVIAAGLMLTLTLAPATSHDAASADDVPLPLWDNHEHPVTTGPRQQQASGPASCIPNIDAAKVGEKFRLNLEGQLHSFEVQLSEPILAELVTEEADGSINHTELDTGIRRISGQIDGTAGEFEFSTGIQGVGGAAATANGTFLLSPAGNDGGNACAHIRRDTDASPSSAAGAGSASLMAATAPIKFLVGIDSAMYNKFSWDHVAVADNIMFRAENLYSRSLSQTLTVYKYLISTSTTTDANLGMAGTSAGSVLSNWGSTSAARSDTSSWHAAILMSSATEPSPGVDGLAHGGWTAGQKGRYSVIWNDYSGNFAPKTSDWYQYAGYLAAHEIGHNFGSAHTADYFSVTQVSCAGGIYQPSPPAPLPPHYCVGYSNNCQGTVIRAVTNAQGWSSCVGSSPPKVVAHRYYVMSGCGSCEPHNPSANPPHYWNGGFDTASKSAINSCLPNWHSTSRAPGSYSC